MKAEWGESSASFVRKQRWQVGDRLQGDPIRSDNGKIIENGCVIEITAIGETSVLAKRIESGRNPPHESTWEFSSREWTKVKSYGLADALKELGFYANSFSRLREAEMFIRELLDELPQEVKERKKWI